MDTKRYIWCEEMGSVDTKPHCPCVEMGKEKETSMVVWKIVFRKMEMTVKVSEDLELTRVANSTRRQSWTYGAERCGEIWKS